MPNGILLLSGGIDSAVAARFALDEGHSLVALHFATKKITGLESLEKSKKLAKMLGLKRLFVCEASDQFAEIARTCEHRYYFVLMKRLMLKTAQRLAATENCEFIVTGESLGQVSSQTLYNLSVIDLATKLPVLRPLLGFDKQQIVDLAKKIGTLETSTGKEMCDALGPPKPATKSELAPVLVEEKKLSEKFVQGLELVLEKI